MKRITAVLILAFTFVVSAETQITFDADNVRVELNWTFEKWDSKVSGFNLYRLDNEKSKKVILNEKLIKPGKTFRKIKQISDLETYNDLTLGKNIEVPQSYYLKMFAKFGHEFSKKSKIVFWRNAEAVYAGLGYWDQSVQYNQEYKYFLHRVLSGNEEIKPVYTFEINTKCQNIPVKVDIIEVKRDLWGSASLSWKISKEEFKKKKVKDFTLLLSHDKPGLKPIEATVFKKEFKDHYAFFAVDKKAPDSESYYLIKPLLHNHHQGKIIQVKVPAKKERLPHAKKLTAKKLPAKLGGAILEWKFPEGVKGFTGFRIQRFKKGEEKPEFDRLVENTELREYADIFEGVPRQTYTYKVITVSQDERHDVSETVRFSFPFYRILLDPPKKLSHKYKFENGKPYAVLNWQPGKDSDEHKVAVYLNNFGWKTEEGYSKNSAQIDLSSFGNQQVTVGVYAINKKGESNYRVLNIQSIRLKEHPPILKFAKQVGGFVQLKWSHDEQPGYTKGYRVYVDGKKVLGESSLTAGVKEAYLSDLVPNKVYDFYVKAVFGKNKETEKSTTKSTGFYSKPEIQKPTFNFNKSSAEKKKISKTSKNAGKEYVSFYVEYLEDKNGNVLNHGRKFNHNFQHEKIYDLNYSYGKLDGMQKMLDPKGDKFLIYFYDNGKHLSLKDYESKNGPVKLSEPDKQNVVNPRLK